MSFGSGPFGGLLFGGAVPPPFVPPTSATNGQIRRTLLAIVQTCSGLPDGSVVWTDQPRPYVPPDTRALVRLSLSRSRRTGWSDSRFQVSDGSGRLVQGTYGRRFRTLTIACDCYEEGDDDTADPILERIRTQLAWDSSAIALRTGANICRADDTDIADLPLYSDGRAVSSASFDVHLSIGNTMADAANPIDYIETVVISEG